MTALKRRDGTAAPARPQSMDLARWDPWSEFGRLRSEMDRLFGSIFGPTPAFMEELPAPPVDIYETAEEVVLRAYLPGTNREDIQLAVEGDTLHLSGESRLQMPEKDVTVHLSQGSYGRFDFRYTLPVEVQPDKVQAQYTNGVLEVHLPKAEGAKRRAIPIQIRG